MNIQSFKWTDENVATLVKLTSEGLTYSDIGERLGITKNSVIGKIHRMAVAPPVKAIVPKPEKVSLPPRRVTNPMTPAMIETAAKMWRADKPATEIAKSIGKTATQLLNFAYNNRDLFPARKQGRKAYKAKRAPSIEPAPDCIDPSIFLPPAGYDAERLEHGKPLHELSKRCCHWPLGNGGPFIFCAAPTQVINGYCEHHRKRAFKPRLALD